MLQSTRAIVWRTVKYGETSIICTMYTEVYGLQSYLVNGVRTMRKSGTLAGLYQPGMLLDVEVYHSPHKNLQRIREVRAAHFYKHMPHDLVRNSLTIFCCELLYRCITEPECNAEWFDFFYTAFVWIDELPANRLVNMSLWFSWQLARLMGFGLQNEYSPELKLLDLQNGLFCNQDSLHTAQFVQAETAEIISIVYQWNSPQELMIHQSLRQEILQQSLSYLRIHLPHLGELKSVPILHTLLRG
jgi:DNA repair protein RecO (recombination protein O)